MNNNIIQFQMILGQLECLIKKLLVAMEDVTEENKEWEKSEYGIYVTCDEIKKVAERTKLELLLLTEHMKDKTYLNEELEQKIKQFIQWIDTLNRLSVNLRIGVLVNEESESKFSPVAKEIDKLTKEMVQNIEVIECILVEKGDEKKEKERILNMMFRTRTQIDLVALNIMVEALRNTDNKKLMAISDEVKILANSLKKIEEEMEK